MGGCGEVAKMGVTGVMHKVGAKVVEGSSDEDLIKMFEQANEACPTRMDAFTTLVEVKLIDERQAEFRYIVNDQGKQLLTRINKRTLKQAAVDHMKGNAMAVAVAQRDLSIEHIYEDSRGSHLLSYTINRDVLAGNLDPVGDERSNPFDVTTVKAEATDSVLQEEQEEVESAPIVEQAPIEEQAPIVEPPLPQKFESPKRSKDNPAGVQGNPFFTET
jgi:hypothetical protein